MNVRSGTLPWRPGLTAALAAAAIFVYWTQLSDRGARDHSRGPAVADSRVSTEGRGWGSGVGFVDSRRLYVHYEKPGAEFGNISKQDYLHQAQLLRDAKVEGPILQTVRADGVTTRFDRQTGAFTASNPH